MNSSDAGSIPFGMPRCPDCDGDMVGYRIEGEPSLLWSCRACGSVFSTGVTGNLLPFPTDLAWPLCPDCGIEMLALTQGGSGASLWRCPGCEFMLAL